MAILNDRYSSSPDFKKGLPLPEAPNELVKEPRRFPKAQAFIDTLGIDSCNILSDSVDINGCLVIAIGPDNRYLVTEDRIGEKCVVSRYYSWPTMAVGLHVLDLLFREGWRGSK